jgi:hypothetical protein
MKNLRHRSQSTLEPQLGHIPFIRPNIPHFEAQSPPNLKHKNCKLFEDDFGTHSILEDPEDEAMNVELSQPYQFRQASDQNHFGGANI